MTERYVPEQGGERFEWRTSRFSGPPSSTCVEVANLADGRTAVRDSKDPAGPMLMFTNAEWRAFVRGVRAGDFSE